MYRVFTSHKYQKFTFISVSSAMNSVLRVIRSPGFSGARLLHRSAVLRTSNAFFSVKDIDSLSLKIDEQLANGKVDSSLVLDAVKACQVLQNRINDYDKFWQDPANIKISSTIKRVLSNDNVVLDNQLLKQLFLVKLPIVTDIEIIKTFYEKNPQGTIDKSVAMIPFRKCLYDGDLKDGLKIIDLTTGHPNYVKAKNEELRSGAMKLIGTAVGITFFSKIGVQQVIDLGLLSPGWKHLGSINSMILTYFFNSSFFVTIVRFGRTLMSSGGDYLTWQKGTFYTHWFRHADEMMMCSKLMDADFKLNKNSENSPELVEELCRVDENVSGGGSTLKPGYTRDGHKVRLLEAKDNLEDLKLQAYWMSGGDGFEWVEPDQDPAELLWRKNLDRFNKPGVGESNTKQLKWADELIGEN